MSTPVPAPPVRTRTGQPCVAPSVADAVIGLLLLVLPLLAAVAWTQMRDEPGPGWVLPAFAVGYLVTCVIAVHGFLSDASPWQVEPGEPSLGASAAALVFGFALVWGTVFVALPDAEQAVAATAERIEQAEASATSAAESASSAGETVTIEAVRGQTAWEGFLATGVQSTIGTALVLVAVAAFGYLVVAYAQARVVQRRRYPRPGPFDIPDPPTRSSTPDEPADG